MLRNKHDLMNLVKLLSALDYLLGLRNSNPENPVKLHSSLNKAVALLALASIYSKC